MLQRVSERKKYLIRRAKAVRKNHRCKKHGMFRAFCMENMLAASIGRAAVSAENFRHLFGHSFAVQAKKFRVGAEAV